MTPDRKVLEGLSRAYVLLKEHPDLPAATVIVFPHGRVELEVSSVHTIDEAARRKTVEELRVAAHLPTPAVKGAYFTTEDRRWRISTPVKVTHTHCDRCGVPQ